MTRGILMIALAAAASGTAAAQVPGVATPTLERRLDVELAGQSGGTFRAAVEMRVTKNAPYSAEAVTESTQVLADGNRIVRKTVTRVYRDSEGRTRRENVRASDGQVENISISDPVSGASFMLDPETRTAYRGNGLIAAMAGGRGGMAVAQAGPSAGARVRTGGGGLTEQEKREIEAGAVAAARAGQATGTLKPALERSPGGDGQSTKEDLGQQMIDGVMATGTRTTTVIPAGSIGNEQPLRIVSEQWFSADLELLVMTKHSDPRVGETTYRLANVVRGDPDRSLFEVPADYTVKESGIRRPMVR